MLYEPKNLSNKGLTLHLKKICILLDHRLNEGLTSDILDYNIDYDKDCLKYFKDSFEPLVSNHDIIIDYINDHTLLFEYLQNEKPEFLINLVNYGFMGNERSEYFSSLFEMLNVPFSNAGMSGMALSNDKYTVHRIALSQNIPTPKQIMITTNDILSKKHLKLSFEFPAFMKLRFGKGSCGITELNYFSSIEELYNNFPKINMLYLQQSALQYDQWLLQEYLPGPEYNVGVIGNVEEKLVLPIMEDQLEINRFKTYEDKKAEKEDLKIAVLSQENRKIIENSALKLFDLLGCRDYCRMDFRCDKYGVPNIMDINPTSNYGEKEAFARSAALIGWDAQTLRRELFLVSLKRNQLITILAQ